MAKAKDEDIDVVLDTPETSDENIEVVSAEETPKAEAAPAPASDPIDDSINELKRRLDAEQRARYDAERRANEASKQFNQARSQVDDTNIQLIDSAMNMLKMETDNLKAHYRDAMSAGDYDKASEIQVAMSSNAAKTLQLEQGKAAMEQQAKQPREPEIRPVSPPADPVEAFASQLSPRSAEWIRRNPQCVTDQRLFNKMMAAHQLALADGIAADSDDYFRSVEGTLGFNKAPVVDEAVSAAAAPTQRRQSAPAAAPVSRGTGSSNVVRISNEEREMARMMGMTDKEYALNKQALQKEGKLTH